MLAFLCMLYCAVNAQEYNKSQENLRNEISSFLSKRSLSPEKCSDGLKFKSSGIDYYIEIDQNEENPMFIRLCRYMKYDGSITREKISENLNEYNHVYGTKTVCLTQGVRVSADLYICDASEFSFVFDAMLSQVKSCCSVLND